MAVGAKQERSIMASNALMFQSIARSNLPQAEKKSLIRNAFESVTGTPYTLSKAERFKAHAIGLGEAARGGAEALFFGGLFGLIQVHAPGGLDYKMNQQQKHAVPIDFGVAVLSLAGSVAIAHTSFGTDLRNLGMSGLNIFGYRKMIDLAVARKNAAGQATPPHLTPGAPAGAAVAGERDEVHSLMDELNT
jgi:hypothetical protein